MLEILGQINERQREAVEKIEIGISHITDMTHRLTYLSRLEFGEKIDLEYAYIDVPTLLKEIGNEMEIALRDTRITYEVKSAENLPLLKADVILLRQVLANLIGNAIKYIGKGDRITARCDQPEPASYRIEIIDNGPGIRAEDQAHLFKAFYRAKHHPGDPDPPTGSGLGLALVRAIVEAHGGSVEVHSEFGKGAAFQLILPVARL
jgi:signal transduction histidine kinase